MRNFIFEDPAGEDLKLEGIIKDRNRRLARQQVTYTTILTVIVVLLVYYFGRKVVYTEFEGYVRTDYVDFKALDDMFLFEQYKREGDIVYPGDTLYSYMYLNNLLFQEYTYNEPSVVVEDRSLRLKIGVATQDIAVLRVRVEELRKQIGQEDHNIRFGLTDNSHKMDLERQLAEARAELAAAVRKLAWYRSVGLETKDAAARSGYYERTNLPTNDLDVRLIDNYYESPQFLRYAIVRDTSVVTKRWSADYQPRFKGESVTQLQDLNISKCNMKVLAYVPTSKMGRINRNTQATVIVNDKVSYKASVKLFGALTEDLPDDLKNSLSRTYNTLIVVFTVDPGQTIPFWATVDKVPVTVRIRNFANGKRGDGSDYWIIDDNGLTDESLKFITTDKGRASDADGTPPQDEETATQTDTVEAGKK